ncbi:MAG TPA: RedB protein [Thermoanaerobaculia bacterium]|nr:RedB protein [Thermoanaerobaculia bacterium]
MNRRHAVSAVLVVAGLLWAATVFAMFHAMRQFEATPGRAADARTSWPEKSNVPRPHGAWTLVTLMHPQCSCSRATVDELQAILEKAPPSVRSFVLVYRPSEFPAGWENTEVVKAAAHLPRTQLIIDPDAREAKLFGGFTSGQTFLYDGDGRLRFSGGVTALRGHTGLNRGAAEVLRIAQSKVGTSSHPVFGCAIVSHTEGAPQ